MAVPGRISAGPAGPAESALLPDAKGSKQNDVKSRSDGSRENKGMELAQRSPKDN